MEIPEKKKPTKRWDNVFKAKWTVDHPFIKVSRRGEKHAFCELCRSDFSICHGGQMPVVNEATGKNIASALKASLKQGGLDVEQCVAFSSDNASVMTGQHRGVMSYLRKGNKDIHLVG
ncbi:hypothetical protein CgunFtcFv8_024997 [Champsocephalus gunnari]|nr:hypothetical protein CgunFtcFv8_024997 [Champsocephalus gunnari]